MREGSAAVVIKSGAANSWNGEGRQHLPDDGYPFCGLTPPVCRGTEIGEPIDREPPMEPPIGYGSTHRSIFPESQFRPDGSFVVQGGPIGEEEKVD
jgi:hypothetical protein